MEKGSPALLSLQPLILGLSEEFKEQLKHRFSPEELTKIIEKSFAIFEQIIPEIPEVGTENPFLKNLVGAAYEMGLYEILETKGLSLQEISVINQNALGALTHKAMTPEIIKMVHQKAFSKQAIAKNAIQSQKRIYPDDWVYEYISPAPGENFDFGMMFTECAIVKLYKKLGKERFLPYVCLNDYVVHSEMAVDICRSQTIGSGGIYCDFKLKLRNTPYTRIIEKPEELPEFNR